MENKNKKNQQLIVIYKLLGDVLFLLLISLVGALVANGLIPGIFYSLTSFVQIVLLILIVVGLLILIENKLNFNPEEKQNNSFQKKPLIYILLPIAALLIINSVLKFHPVAVFIITLSAFIFLFYFYKILVQKKD